MTSHHAAGPVEPAQSAGSAAAAPDRTPHVTAVIVAHNGHRWLPKLMSSLEVSTRFPDQLVAIDTGSTDGTAAYLDETLGPTVVHTVDRGLGFGAAVQVAVDLTAPVADPDGWLWLLHDDCAPAADALEQLLEVGAPDPAISVVGGRVRAWPRAQRLLEGGVTITGTGHRETGVELGEHDQGQHDRQHDVLSVSSAGMLVRRRTWAALGGFDSELPLFRDDLDFGWRVAKSGGRVVFAPAAVVFHAEAGARGVRSLDDLEGLPDSPHRADRQAALFALLANCRGLAFPFQYVRLFLGSILRALFYLAGKLPRAAGDELLAMVSVLGRPGPLLRARSRRRATSDAPHSKVRTLLPAWWTPYLNGLDSILSRFADTLRDTAAQVAAAARRRRRGAAGVEGLETGPVPDEAVNLPTGPGPVTWALGHPILALTLVLTLAAAIASRHLWGGGWLRGGALLPAPASSSAWWQTYTESWHQVGLGSGATPSPYLAVLGLASAVVLGKSWLLVELILVLAVPLSAIGAYVAARQLIDSLAVRIWMSLSYALIPALSGVVTSGHLGTTVALILLPWLFRLAIPLVATASRKGPTEWRPVFAVGLVLSVIVAFAPIGWPMAVVVALAGAGLLAATGERRPDVLSRPIVAAALPAVLLLPWSARLLTSPSLFLAEAGRIDPGTASVAGHAWLLPWGRLAAAGAAPWWLSLGLVLAALASLLRTDRRGAIAAAWAVVALGLLTAAVMATTLITIPGTQDQAFVWVGLPVALAQAAAIMAVGLAADGVSRFIEAGHFGWRQPLAAVTAGIALIGPLAGLLWWVGAAPHGDLTRARAVPVPAYMSAAIATSDQRVLVIDAAAQPDSAGASSNTYTVYAGDGLRLGDDSVVPAPDPAFTRLLTKLLSEASESEVNQLAELGIAYVVLRAPFDTDQVAQLDGAAGLTPSTSARRLLGWQVEAPARDVAAPVEPGGHRGWWVALQLLLVLTAIVLAAPALQRGPAREPGEPADAAEPGQRRAEGAA